MYPKPGSPPLTAQAAGLMALYCLETPRANPAELEAGPRIMLAEGMNAVRVSPPGTALDLRGDSLVLVIDGERLESASRIPERESCDPFLHGIARTLRAGFRRNIRPPEPYLASLASHIAAHLRAYYARPGSREGASGLSAARLERVLRYLDANLAGPCSLDELAEAAYLSPFHFSRMFRRSTGKSPHAYLVDRRMERARALLEGTTTPIADIARMVGFRTQSHFTNAFRQVNGIAPGAYRARGRLASISAREID